jgi:shikimate dehydrogenase
VRISGNTRLLVVLGDPVAHSLSPAMHNAAFVALGLDAVYVALRAPLAEFPDILRSLAALGVAGNVTVPLKGAAERCVTRKTELCERVGACNTFWVERHTLVGDNTDAPAIQAELAAMGIDGGRWLLLGTGGSARAVAVAAAEARAELFVRSRDPERARGFVEWAASRGAPVQATTTVPAVDVVVNSTPVGLEDGDPLPLEPGLVREAGALAALDLVYRPGTSRWVREMRKVGVRAQDGRGVLVRQGALAWQRFFPDDPAPLEVMRAAVSHALW